MMDQQFRTLAEGMLGRVKPADSVVVAVADQDALVSLVHSDRPGDLVAMARSLLVQAGDRMDMATGAVTMEDVTLFGRIRNALHHLPDPDADPA
jgi:hypothetical protein